MSSIREKIKEEGFVVGSWINSASPIIAELMAYTGFDFLTVDVEHSAVDLNQTQMLIQAIQAGNPDCYPLVRLPSIEPTVVKRFLDSGAEGVVAPLINNPEMAATVVSASKYPPLGKRGAGFSRSNKYGLAFRESVPHDNEKIFVCVQIEHIEGVINLDDILRVPGIDAILIGPYDLSASIGIPGQLDHPEMVSMKNTILQSCIEHEMIAGIHVVSPDVNLVEQHIDQGYKFISFSLDITIIGKACEALMNSLNR